MLALRSFGQLVTALLVCLPAPMLEAQSSVTATSGDSLAIRRIRSEFETIERSLSRYRKIERDIDNVSTEGGHATAYYDGDHLRKLDVGIFGESGSRWETYYFRRGAPFFILGIYQLYPNASLGFAGSRQEDRLYIDSGVVIRRVPTGLEVEPDDPGTSSADPSGYTDWLGFYLRCLAAQGKYPPECEAPDSLSKRSYKPTLGPAGVARHRALYEDIERRLKELRHAGADLRTLKLQGTTSDNGVLDAYCEGDSIRLLVSDFTIPGARSTIRMYFVHDSLFFVYKRAMRRDKAKGGKAQPRESRWYFIDNQLVRELDDDTPLAITTDDGQAEFWLARARDLSGAMPACRPRLRSPRQ